MHGASDAKPESGLSQHGILPNVDTVVGIDLSGLTSGARGHTVAAHLILGLPLQVGDLYTVPRQLKGDRLLIDWIEERRPKVIAIDAPLSLPHSVLCTDPRCPRCEIGAAEYLARDVDRLAGGMPTAMLAAIAFRGIYLARKLRERRYEVIEAYPAAAYRAMGATGKTYEERANLVARRIPSFAADDHDEIDAVCSALIAADYLTSPLVTPIRGTDGEIWRSGSI